MTTIGIHKKTIYNHEMKKRYKKYLLEASTRLYRKPMVRNLVSPFFSDKKPEKWLFILGCYNSGTTLLQNTLALHPTISTLPREGVRFTSVLPQPEDVGWTRMWIKCQDYMDIGSDVTPHLQRQVVRDWSPWFSKNADVFLEKSITNLTRIEWIANNFENCYFLGMTRNGYCVSEGIRRKAMPKGEALSALGSERYPIELCAQQWVEANSLLHKQSNKQYKIMHIKYEEFAKDPASVLANVFTFLEIEQPQLQYENDVLNCNGVAQPVVNMNEKSIRSLNPSDLSKINGVIKETQMSLGYEMLEITGAQ